MVPVTHSPPADPTTAIEIPAVTKARLGLDAQRSWIICNEANVVRLAGTGPARGGWPDTAQRLVRAAAPKLATAARQKLLGSRARRPIAPGAAHRVTAAARGRVRPEEGGLASAQDFSLIGALPRPSGGASGG